MKELVSLHRTEYDEDPDVIVAAPGVINLMGEHTDYNEGVALVAGLNKYLHIAVSKRDDNSLRFFAADYNERKRTTITNLKYKREDRWANKPKSVLWSLLNVGYQFRGLNITITSQIPQEIGLGSSAAVEIATIMAMKTLFDFPYSKRDAVQLAYRGETKFNGTNETITDFYVSAFAKKGNGVFFDINTENMTFVPCSFRGYCLLVTLANVPKVPSSSELKLRRKACEQCLEALKSRRPGRTLLDYTNGDLNACMGNIPEHIRRICMHVIGENERVSEAKTSFQKKDPDAYGKLLSRSHESLRDNYEVSCPEIDWLVKRAWEIDGVMGSRMIGKGFASGTLTLLKKEAIEEYKQRLEEYEHIFGFHPELFFFEASAGVKVTRKSRKRKRT